MAPKDLQTPPSIILASASLRRAELLERLGIVFETKTADICEEEIFSKLVRENKWFGSYLPAKKAASAIARAKARDVFTRFPDHLILAADTIVCSRNQILGKPQNAKEAQRMLRGLSGRNHRVYTAVTLKHGAVEISFCSKATVSFYPLDAFQENLIARYATSGAPLDKAGGYGIQELGGIMVSKIKGDYYTIVGLPIAALARHMRSFGYDITELLEVSDAGIDS